MTRYLQSILKRERRRRELIWQGRIPFMVVVPDASNIEDTVYLCSVLYGRFELVILNKRARTILALSVFCKGSIGI